MAVSLSAVPAAAPAPGTGPSSTAVASPSTAPAPTKPKAKYEVFPVLDGVRVLMTLWVVVFHVLWHTSMVMKETAFDAFYYAPWMRFLNNGLFSVDIFFILTGFLLAYPVLNGARTGTWREFVWLRVTRIYPTLLVSVAFICLGMYYRSPLFTWDRHPSPGIKAMLDAAGKPDLPGVPNNCELSIFNLLFINNAIPFGGCMGWTWSLCVQVHFYLLFPIVISWFGRGSRLAKAVVVGLIGHGLLRFFLYKYAMMPFAPPKVYVFELADKDSFFMYFNVWYSSTIQRMGCIFSGVLLAWVQINKKEWAATLASGGNTLVYLACTALSGLGIWGTFYTDWLSPLHMTFFSVGGLCWLFALCFILYCLINRIGLLARIFAPLLAHPIFSVLQIPTYAVYLTHSAFAMKAWSIYQDHYGPVTKMTWPLFISVASAVVVASFAYGTLCYHLVEKPVKNWLRPAAKSSVVVATTGAALGAPTATATGAVATATEKKAQAAGVETEGETGESSVPARKSRASSRSSKGEDVEGDGQELRSRRVTRSVSRARKAAN